MEFRILGPLEVVDGLRPVSLDAPKQRALLGLLLLHPNEVVSSERVIDELWGERPPATAGKVVQTYVSQLRRALGAASITTRAPGYALEVDGSALDATRFRRLAADARAALEDGDHSRADVLYGEALALWRGPPLADVVLESFGRNEVERLAEERLDALSARIDCELALGQHEQLVTELEQLAAEYPLRERLRGQLMLALYRSGRQADALDVYQNGRHLLVEELGLEPSRELHDLEKAILTHDPALDPRPPQAVPSPHDAPADEQRQERVPRWFRRKSAVAGAALLAAAVALGLAFTFDRGHGTSLRLLPNSVGFIDAKSGRVTRTFQVGRSPDALAVTKNSIWVANFRDETVTRIDRATGRGDTLPVGGHPSSIASLDGSIWVWTLEGLLVRIDPRYGTVGRPVRLAPSGGSAGSPGRIAAGGGYLWITIPQTTILRVDPTHAEHAERITAEWGAGGPIIERGREVWAAGSSYAGYVFPIRDGTDAVGSGIDVGGPVHDLAFHGKTMWVLSGGATRQLPHQALRAIDLHDQLVRSTVPVGNNPVAVVDAAGSIWVADSNDRTISRIDPTGNGRVVETIKLGASPDTVGGDRKGIWVAAT